MPTSSAMVGFGFLKVAITLAFVGTTVSEMTAANEGIGYLLIGAGSSMQMVLAFSGLLVVGIMAMAARSCWANIGRIVYGASEEAALRTLTGNHAENPTLALPCRELFARGQKAVEVIGPFAELEAELLTPHLGFWATP